MSLSQMQKRYIWLAGSHPHLVIEQGQGKRTPITYYNAGAEVLTIFGYGTPLHFLTGRGLVRKLQNGRSYTLTEAGEAAYRRLKAGDDGIDLNAGIRHANFKSEAPTHARIGDQQT